MINKSNILEVSLCGGKKKNSEEVKVQCGKAGLANDGCNSLHIINETFITTFIKCYQISPGILGHNKKKKNTDG